ncbi:MAG: hypothetical protein AAFR15_06515 [Cyanobacteria bacterium J06627_15]
MRPTVFIHTNDKQLLGATVARYALQKNSQHRAEFDVQIIQLNDWPELYQREGQLYLREGEQVPWHNQDLQSFTLLRFLVPQLMGYQGRAIVIDPDVFAVGDVYDLLKRDMQGKAIVCRQIFPKDGRPPYYASSVMLLDCAQLTHWQWAEQIERLFSFEQDYRPWMSLLTEPSEIIGPLEPEWNHFDTLNSETRLLHNTGRITQPWKTGLPIDFRPKKKRPKQAPPSAPVLTPAPTIKTQLKRLKATVKQWLGAPPPTQSTTATPPSPKAQPPAVYNPHPDPNQEAFFFGLLQECLDKGIVTEDFLQAEIARQHLRPDAFQVMGRLATSAAF